VNLSGFLGKRVAVLASSSFAGAALAKTLEKAGALLFSISRRDTPPIDVKFQEHLTANVLTDSRTIIRKLREWEPHIVYDFLGQGMVAPSWKNPRLWFDTNFTAKLPIWNCLDNLSSLDSYVRASTPEVYGEVFGSIAENQSVFPTSPYAVTHATQDLFLLAMQKKSGFPIRLVRSANYYGPSQQPYRLIPRVILSILWGIKFPLEGEGNSYRSFVHSTDFCNAFALAGINGVDGVTYHVGADEVVSISDIVHKLCAIGDIQFENLVETVAARPTEDPRYELNFSRTKSELGWCPNVSLTDGLQDTFNWYANNSARFSRSDLDFQLKS
jgi:dTDP-glucose 4,6-dehydratase